MIIWMDGCSYCVFLLCCCFAVVLLLLLFYCSSVDDEDDEDENIGDDDLCFPPQTDTIDTHVFVEYKRLCTHYTAGLTSAHLLLLRSIAVLLPFCDLYVYQCIGFLCFLHIFV